MKAKGHSLWLMPTGEAYDKLLGLIKRLANEYNAPLFEPHVTLLGEAMQLEEDVLKRIEQLVLGQKPFPITLNTVDYQDFYFRTLFVRAERTDPLQTLHDRAKEVFEMQDIPDYMPHLSLMYGNFPQSVKEQIIKAIGRDQTTEFAVNSVHLFKTDGEANTWYRVKEIPFL
jgi:2'-5' RNA ligase